MIAWLVAWVERRFRIPEVRTRRALARLFVFLAAASFVLVATLILAFNALFGLGTSIANLQVNDFAPASIFSPESVSYESEVLTAEARRTARESVQPTYDPADPEIARSQNQLTQQVLDYIEGVRNDSYASNAQQLGDLGQLTAVVIPPDIAETILSFSDETWNEVREEILNVLTRVMRDSIRESDLATIRAQLPSQVSVRFDSDETQVITTLVGGLIRANTRENPEATEAAREAAAASVATVVRNFQRGQIVVSEGEQVTPLEYEALDKLGLLQTEDMRNLDILQGLVSSALVIVLIGLYLLTFRQDLVYQEPRKVALASVLFLLFLAAARLLTGQIYLFPSAAMALLFVAIDGPHLAIIGSIGLAFLVGLTHDAAFEIATLITAGGLISALELRHPDRLNSFFVVGALVALVNAAMFAVFRLGVTTPDANFLGELLMLLFNGLLLAPALAIALMYVVTLLFNLPTALKLLDLSQPNKPLLQRLLREAPGTYQHSRQVANLASQAAERIGADATLTNVAALYHDIGKMLNPVYFTENQQDIGNPHDALDDPYRSADIITSHVTDGVALARQYRLPERLKDFIREHHGTTEVYVFYRQAIQNAGDDESAVDRSEFTYPGPIPGSRETGILMLADSCEAAVRSRKPQSRNEIRDLVRSIIESRQKSGQLNASHLTLNDLNQIETTFVDMLQGMFHPRINYEEAIARNRDGTRRKKAADASPAAAPANSTPAATTASPPPETPRTGTSLRAVPADDDSPLPEVPSLPRREGNGRKTTPMPRVVVNEEQVDEDPEGQTP
jgi:cyclic-di-AMP phosphodiesterase PgpH